jgi:thioester reductase-like protein
MKKILITGATGLLGTHLTATLVDCGCAVVALVRKSPGLSGYERMKRRFIWLGKALPNDGQLKVVEGELTDPFLGLSKEDYAWLAGYTDEIVHAAGNTSFAEKQRPHVESGNLQALDHLLGFARKARISFFHLLSTAFVNPPEEHICYEKLYQRQQFLNVYEETKYHGERKTVAFCDQHHIPWSIYRPSVVFGDSVTGKTFRFNALYYPVKTLYLLKEAFKKELHANGHRAREMGIFPDGADAIFFPLTVPQVQRGNINLIPVDYMTRAFHHLFLQSAPSSIYHITNPRPNGLGNLLDYAGRFLKINGLQAVDGTEQHTDERNALETLFDKYLGEYNPYLRDTRLFDTSNTLRALQGTGVKCPYVDYPVFEQTMQYALATQWGKMLKLD